MRLQGGIAALAAAGVLTLAGCGGDDARTLDSGETGGVAGTVAEAAESVRNAFKVGLGERAGSGQYGSVTATSLGDEASQVVVELYDGPGSTQYAAIHQGTCRNLGDVELELTDVERGRSATRIERSLDRIRSGDYSVVVRESSDESSDVVACGELDERRALGRAREAASDAEALAQSLCADVPAADLQRVFGWTTDDLRRVAEELTRNVESAERDAVIDACIEELERRS